MILWQVDRPNYKENSAEISKKFGSWSKFGSLRCVRKEISYVKRLGRTLLLIRRRMILSGGECKAPENFTK